MSVGNDCSSTTGANLDLMGKTNLDLHVKQEERLRHNAMETDQWRDLVFFYAARHNWSDLQELQSRVPETDTRGRFLLELMFLAKNQGSPQSLLERLSGESDIWVYYTLAKYFLQQNQLIPALSVAKCSIPVDMIEGMRNSCVLNLIARYLIREGDLDNACEIIASALRLNDRQNDLVTMRQQALEGELITSDLYLDVLPRLEQVSYYVPLYNGEEYIWRVLNSLMEQTYPLHELFVVDDGSTDGGVDIIREFPVRLLVHKTNQGLAAARNTAFQQASGRYVGAVDADVISDKNLLKYLMMETENPPGRVVGVNARLFEQCLDTSADKWRVAHLNQDVGPQRVAPIESMSGAKTLFLREAVLEVGGYDERYRTNYEDVAMCKRLRAAGYDLVATPYAFTGHLRRDTPQSVLKTSWNYAFWACHEAGYYSSREKVVELMTRTLRAEYEIIRWDTEHGSAHLLYLDYLHIFVGSFCDMAFSGQTGLFTFGEVRCFQEAMLDTVRISNLGYGELLYRKVRNDLKVFLSDPGSETFAIPPESEPYLTLLRNFLDAAGDEFCALLLRL